MFRHGSCHTTLFQLYHVREYEFTDGSFLLSQHTRRLAYLLVAFDSYSLVPRSLLLSFLPVPFSFLVSSLVPLLVFDDIFFGAQAFDFVHCCVAVPLCTSRHRLLLYKRWSGANWHTSSGLGWRWGGLGGWGVFGFGFWFPFLKIGPTGAARCHPFTLLLHLPGVPFGELAHAAILALSSTQRCSCVAQNPFQNAFHNLCQTMFTCVRNVAMSYETLFLERGGGLGFCGLRVL